MASMKKCLFVVALLALAAGPQDRPSAQADTSGEWRSYGADLASTRYKPFDQINKDNFNNLEVA